MNSFTGDIQFGAFRGVDRPRSPALQPTEESARLVSIDVLRGFALLGILLMNIQSFSMPLAAYFNPAAYGDLQGMNYWAWLVVHVLIDEKFMVIFSMLFGAGILLMTSRVEASGTKPAKLHYRRMGWLIVFGIIHAYCIWPGDILFDYGLCGMLAFLLRKKSPQTLLTVAVVLISVLPLGILVNSRRVSKMPPERVAAMQERWKPGANEIANEISAYRGGWLSQMRYRIPQARQMAFNGFLLRILGLMLGGMALLKMGWFKPDFPKRVYWWFLITGVAIGLPMVLYGALEDARSGWDVRVAWFQGLPLNFVGSIIMGLGWISLVMLAVRGRVFPAALARLQSLGKTAFSNYILQSVICTSIFYGHGLGLFGEISRVTQLGIVCLVWALQLTIAPMWLRRYQFGPLEWVWRSLTYARREPLRRQSTAPVAGVAA